MIIGGGIKEESSKIMKWFYLKDCLIKKIIINKYITKSIIKKKLTNQKTINTQTREKIILRQPKNLL